MKAVVFSFTQKGTFLAQEVADWLRNEGWDVRQTSLRKFASSPVVPFEPSLEGETQRAFQLARLLLFIGAAGIAVRSIAPFIRKKDQDPAVVVIDEGGQFVIPILSGHIGRANEWARQLAAAIKGQAVITTATDVNALFAVDEWAARKGLRLSSLKDAKNFAAGLLSAGKAGLYSDFPIEGPLPPGLVAATDGPTGLVVTTKDRMALFEVSVLVRPVILHVGIGCRRGTSASTIEDAVLSVFEEANLSLQAVADVSSIDVKGDEEGLLAFARMHSWPIRFFSADELNAVPGTFTASDFVRQTVGTDNVCERSAVRASHGGDLVVSKKAGQGITVAVACESYSLCFSNV